MRHPLTGWRFAALVGGLVGALGLALYPIAIAPYLNSDEWKKIQEVRVSHVGITPLHLDDGAMLQR